jgi:hypothetical protein
VITHLFASVQNPAVCSQDFELAPSIGVQAQNDLPDSLPKNLRKK